MSSPAKSDNAKSHTGPVVPSFEPPSAMETPRFAGIPTFMRLPLLGLSDTALDDVDIAILGVPWDGGTTNRPGPRHGPRQYPILKALGADQPLGMVHFDAHTDLFDSYFNGYRYTHGTPFRRAIEDGYLDPKRVVQIGIRGTMYDGEDVEWGLAQGVRIIRIEEVEDRGIADVMKEAREIVGTQPTYVSFDIDAIDPAFAPGTGTPEIGGFTSREAQRMVRMLDGLNLVGADLVEVSPPFDQSGGTAWLGISIMFELLCVLAASPATRNPNNK